MSTTIVAVISSTSDLDRLQESLRGEGVNIEWACSSDEAILLAAANQTSVIVYDIDSGHSWREAIRKIRSELPDVPVILSGSGDRRKWLDLFGIGSFDVIFKPFEPGNVRSVIRNVLYHPAMQG